MMMILQTLIIGVVMVLNTWSVCGQTTAQRPDLGVLMATYKSKPVYYVVYSNQGCLVDIRINDARVEKVGDPVSTGGTAITANPAILKSGKQRVTVRLTPHEGKGMITFSKPFTLKIGYKDFMEQSGEGGRPWHWVLEMPPVVVPKEGLPYYEWIGEFDAEVPYVARGWTDCIDLRNVPNIEQRVVAKFEELRQLIINKRYDEIRRIKGSKHYELALTMYETEKDISDSFSRDERKYDMRKGLNYEPIDQYSLEFYADGRLVTLEKHHKDAGWFPSALLWLEDDGDDGWNYIYYKLQFGIRKGTNELVLIR